DHVDRQRADAALDRKAQLSPSAGQGDDLVGICLLREQPACSDRIGKLCHRRRRAVDADPEESVAAGPPALSVVEFCAAMRAFSSIGALTVAAMLCVPATSAGAHDEKKYPDMRAQWTRIGSAAFDPNKPG